ncbi:MAG: metallophosphoesterase [Clostridia bacterium]|nr:metallophosphoesterase [Clostridia bacterium]
MKKIASFVLVLATLCCLLAFTANMAAQDNEGLGFAKGEVYHIANDLPDMPVTVEAVIYFNKRAKLSNNSAFFGNKRGSESCKNIGYYITADGNPKITLSEYPDGVVTHSYTFDQVNVIKSEWVHLTIVRDIEKKEIRCYLNGELAQSLPTEEETGKHDLWDFVVGGDMNSLNVNWFRGRMKSLAVYSDVRTDKEIKADMEKVGTSDLILHYDFSANTEKAPLVLKDLSGSGCDAKYSRIVFDEPRNPAKDYAFSFVAIGDTQRVALDFPENFSKTYEWIYDNIEAKNIEMVIGLGDITDTNNGENTPFEWETALKGFKIIDGYVDHIPARGNHDSIFWYNKTMSSLPGYTSLVSGLYKENDYRNAYVLKNIGGIPYLFLQFDYTVDADVLNWAKGVVEAYPDHNVVVSRHGYLFNDGTTMSWTDSTFGSIGIIGDEMWDQFISQYENIVLVLSGHISNDHALLTQRKGVHGNTVTEMLLDFQHVDNTLTNNGYSEGGSGTVNIFHFSEDGRTVQFETYSPIMGKYFYDLNQFTFELDLVGDQKYVKPAKAPIPPRTEAKKTEIKMTIDSLTAFVNGEAKALDAAPIIRNSRTMLPVRFVAENLGATVGWDGATQTVTIKRDATTIEIVIGSKIAKVNGNNIALDSPAFIENSRTYLPVRVVAENLGATVGWDDATKTATLTK